MSCAAARASRPGPAEPGWRGRPACGSPRPAHGGPRCLRERSRSCMIRSSTCCELARPTTASVAGAAEQFGERLAVDVQQPVLTHPADRAPDLAVGVEVDRVVPRARRSPPVRGQRRGGEQPPAHPGRRTRPGQASPLHKIIREPALLARLYRDAIDLRPPARFIHAPHVGRRNQERVSPSSARLGRRMKARDRRMRSDCSG